MEFERAFRKKREANLVPLIDVALFLLIFFMVAGSIEKFEIIPVETPVAVSGKLMDEGHIIILLGAREEVVVGDELITLDDLERVIKEQLAGNPDKIITVKADGEIPAVRMIEVMDRIKAAGGHNLSIATHSMSKQHAE